MVNPNRFKSRTYRRIFVTTPGGNEVTHYARRKPARAQCVCGEFLHAVPHENVSKMKTMPKTYKRPERPYGGVLCSSCMRLQILKGIIKDVRNV